MSSFYRLVKDQIKILIVGPAWVGDMVMAQSLFKLLKQREFSPIIDVLAPSWTSSILSRMPEIRKGISLPFKHGEFKLKERFRLARQLQKEHYDEVIVLPNSFKSAVIPFAAQIPKRTGWIGELRFGILNDVRVLDKKNYPRMVERFAALAFPAGTLLPHIPLPSLMVTSPSVNKALEAHGIKPPVNRVMALCPGAEFGPSKRWPANYFAEIARRKIAQGFDVWLLGSPKDVELSKKIQEATDYQCIDLTGKTSLAEAIDLLSLVDVVVANDSGLMHIAAALDRPLVALYGPTSADFTPPLGSKSRILSKPLSCSPCFKRACPLMHHKCMRELMPLQVDEAINTLVPL